MILICFRYRHSWNLYFDGPVDERDVTQFMRALRKSNFGKPYDTIECTFCIFRHKD